MPGTASSSSSPTQYFPTGRFITWRIPETSQVSPQKIIFYVYVVFRAWCCMVFVLLKKRGVGGLGGFWSYRSIVFLWAVLCFVKLLGRASYCLSFVLFFLLYRGRLDSNESHVSVLRCVVFFFFLISCSRGQQLLFMNSNHTFPTILSLLSR